MRGNGGREARGDEGVDTMCEKYKPPHGFLQKPWGKHVKLTATYLYAAKFKVLRFLLIRRKK